MRTVPVLLAALAASVLAGVIACLPDLGPPSEASPDGAAPARPPACGDGFVNARLGEQCDPGDAGEAGAPGCSPACVVDCPEGGFVDPTSRHCYFRLPGERKFVEASSACAAQGGHIVTFAGEDEHATVTRVPGLLEAPTFWVGLVGSNDAGFRADEADEPGWAPDCTGCFARLPGLDAAAGLPGAGGCVAASTARDVPWSAVSCDAPRAVVCEREPLGSRVEVCNGPLCTDVPRTSGSGKRYLFVKFPVTSESAEEACRAFENGRLVVFTSPEEREQLFFELRRAGAFDNYREFWVGLSRGIGADAGAWIWDDGAEAEGPLRTPWARGEPATTAPARAYVARTSDVDTQLAHASALGAVPSRGLPYVCEYYPTTN